MNKPKIILHVGTEKTGSTSIQSTLAKNHSLLVAQKILFPVTIANPTHISITACALSTDKNAPIRKLLDILDDAAFSKYRNNILSIIKSDINKYAPEKIIISDEHINSHLDSPEKLQEFKEICESFGEVETVIIYLRRPDNFRLSLFTEAVKSGNFSHFNIDNPLPDFEVIPYRLNYLSILDNLANTFGREKLKPYIFDPNLFPEGDVVQHFLEKCGLPPLNIKDEDAYKNKSIDKLVVKPLAVVSKKLSKIGTDKAHKLREQLVRSFTQHYTGPGIKLAPEKHLHYLSQFQPIIDEVKTKYFPEYPPETELFKQPAFESTGDRPYPDCSISWPKFLLDYISNFSLMHDENESTGPIIQATCSVCAEKYPIDITVISREGKLCPDCGASGRAQAIAHSVSRLLCGNNLPLVTQKVDKSKTVVGLSDGRVYADILEKKFQYTNTFYHQEPFLDITEPPSNFTNRFDLLITTEVFEHVIKPSLYAFKGAYKILKPGGQMILTVPFINEGSHQEHYPELESYDAHQDNEGNWYAELTYLDGRKTIDSNAKFHGGPGKTLEIRLFNRQQLLHELEVAGFTEIIVHDENLPQHGINWNKPSRLITATKPL